MTVVLPKSLRVARRRRDGGCRSACPHDCTSRAAFAFFECRHQARDTRLRRLVAIKIVRNLGQSGYDSAESLIREARHASRLNHPNICTVHHIGEFDGQPFIVIAWPDRLLGKDARLEQRKGWSGWHVDAFNLASLHARVGHTDEALRWLRTAYDARSTARCGC